MSPRTSKQSAFQRNSSAQQSVSSNPYTIQRRNLTVKSLYTNQIIKLQYLLFHTFFCCMDVKRLASLYPLILFYESSPECVNAINNSIIVSSYCFYIIATNANTYFHNFVDSSTKYCFYGEYEISKPLYW